MHAQGHPRAVRRENHEEGVLEHDADERLCPLRAAHHARARPHQAPQHRAPLLEVAPSSFPWKQNFSSQSYCSHATPLSPATTMHAFSRLPRLLPSAPKPLRDLMSGWCVGGVTRMRCGGGDVASQLRGPARALFYHRAAHRRRALHEVGSPRIPSLPGIHACSRTITAKEV